MGAGHETTASTAAAALWALAAHPEAEARVHAELDRVLGARCLDPGTQEESSNQRFVIQCSGLLVLLRSSVEPCCACEDSLTAKYILSHLQYALVLG